VATSTRRCPDTRPQSQAANTRSPRSPPLSTYMAAVIDQHCGIAMNARWTGPSPQFPESTSERLAEAEAVELGVW
jgi:hypothetical protein